jgi:hypothetical protein
MHFFKLLPSVIAPAIPASSKPGFEDLVLSHYPLSTSQAYQITEAVLYTEQNMQGGSFGIPSSLIDRCITLDDVVLVARLVKYSTSLTVKKDTATLAR